MRVKECMCKKIVSATPETTVNEIAKLMQENNIGSVPICNEEKCIVGFVTDRDIITRCVAFNKNSAQTKVSDIMSTKIIKTTPDTELEYAMDTMSKNQIRRLPVIENNQVIGILTIGDLAQNDNVSDKSMGNTMENICECK